ncbi:MAG: sensor histidine kinase [Bacteroidetes bacterium]|nr:sensor histidine kinase [Bacteroidota bacterium]
MVNKTKSTLYIIGIHAVLWLFMLILPVVTVAPFILSANHTSSQMFYLMFGYSSIILLLVFYTNYFFLFPRFYLNDKKIVYFLLVVFTLLIVAIITRFVIANLFDFNEIHAKPNFIYVAFGFFRIFLAFFVSGALVVFKYWQKSERERLLAEVSFLKAQINPHFLFNTLNGIYTLTLKKSDKVPDSVAKLSALMQYVATDATKEKVLLSDEINYITNYIELQKLRLIDTTQVSFKVEGSPSSLLIEPLLLITFVENAFKHGVSTENRSEIKIEMKITKADLHFYVYNTKSNSNHLDVKTTEIGLENTISRLKRSYSGKHSLNISENEESYTVNLILKLK